MAVSKKHLVAVRKLPCCVCGNSHTVEAHHLRSLDYGRGMGRKSGDEWVVPLCKEHHDSVHMWGTKREPRWFQEHAGFDPALLAEELWGAWDLYGDDVLHGMTWITVSYIGGDS